MTDITFHYPPELFNLLVDTIPLLNRSKKDVIIFFRGAGVSENILSEPSQQLKSKSKEISKFEITRNILEQLNQRGESALRERREILRRVVNFTNLDSCWPSDQMKAKGLIASIREVVNEKDAFTRMNQARQQEREARLAETEKETYARRERSAKIEMAKSDFYGLFGSGASPQTRGKKLETALNNLFKAYGVLVKEAFHLVGQSGEGVIEQIDGVIEIKGIIHFVEMKWYQSPVGKAEIAEHLVRLIGRAEARGIIISASDYTEPAIQTCREFLTHKIHLVRLHERRVHRPTGLIPHRELPEFREAACSARRGMTTVLYHSGKFPPATLDWQCLLLHIGPANAAILTNAAYGSPLCKPRGSHFRRELVSVSYKFKPDLSRAYGLIPPQATSFLCKRVAKTPLRGHYERNS